MKTPDENNNVSTNHKTHPVLSDSYSIEATDRPKLF
jgi:hypothetical protein